MDIAQKLVTVLIEIGFEVIAARRKNSAGGREITDEERDAITDHAIEKVREALREALA